MLGPAAGRAASGAAAVAVTTALIASLTLSGGAAAGGAGSGERAVAPGDRPAAVSAAAEEAGRAFELSATPGSADAAPGAMASEPPTAATQAESPGIGTGGAVGEAVPVFTVTVVRRYPHDPNAFTQGLVWRDGALFESVGREGRSEVRRVNLKDGRVLARSPIPADQFGEGLAANGPELISLTWKNGVAYRWDRRTLKPLGRFSYPGDGWGLAGDGRELALSDGTPTLRFMDPRTFAERRRVTVTMRGRPLADLNELEWIDGALWGNVWHTPFLVRIDPVTGRVTALADLRPIVAEVNATDPEAVANGVAADPRTGRLLVTGKLWPTLFEVRLTPAR